MLPLERRHNIIKQISINKSVRVVELSREFGVTEETIRRDLEKLEKEGVLVRTYGGAVHTKKPSGKLPLSARLRENIEGKKLIGKIISGLIHEGDTVMIGSGSTNQKIARQISTHKNIKIITNSVGTLSEVMQNNDIKIICTGGVLSVDNLSFTGSTAMENINSYYADKVILSCRGIDTIRGIMESNEGEVGIKRTMIKCGKTIILVVDHTKFDSYAIVTLFNFKDIDIVVTDIKPCDRWMRFFEDNDIRCIYEV